MSDQQPQPPSTPGKTILFVTILCFCSALILAGLAVTLRDSQDRAKALDVAKQILKAAGIYNIDRGYFELPTKDGHTEPAHWDSQEGVLVPGAEKATADQIYAVYKARLRPMLTDAKGKLQTFQEANIDFDEYIAKNQKTGYANLPQKLIYLILPNEKATETAKPEGYILPVSGYGLWGPVWGYLAIKSDADTVIGTTWDPNAETPGLGAVIGETGWQAQFTGKKIFQPSASGQTNYDTANLGIIVVKGKVSDVFGDNPRSRSAVDGISGATLTGNGVNAALKDSLGPYRAFLLATHNESGEKEPVESAPKK